MGAAILNWSDLDKKNKPLKAWTAQQVQQMLVRGFVERAEYVMGEAQQGRLSGQDGLEVMLHSCMVMIDGNSGGMCAIGITRPEAWRKIEPQLEQIDKKAQLIMGNWQQVLDSYLKSIGKKKGARSDPVDVWNGDEFDTMAKSWDLEHHIGLVKQYPNLEAFNVSGAWASALAVGLYLALEQCNSKESPVLGLKAGCGFLVRFLTVMCDGAYGFDPVVMYTMAHKEEQKYHVEQGENWFLPFDASHNPLEEFDFGGSLGISIREWSGKGVLWAGIKQMLDASKEARVLEQCVVQKDVGNRTPKMM